MEGHALSRPSKKKAAGNDEASHPVGVEEDVAEYLPALRCRGVSERLDAHCMAEAPAHHAHDKLFELGFGEPSCEAAFVRSHLPPELGAAIAWWVPGPEVWVTKDGAF